MKQWDIFLYKFEEEKPHYVVIVSSQARIDAGNPINGLFCRTIRAAKPIRFNEVPLDRVDGFDWSTGVVCDFFYQLDPKKFLEKQGEVSYERRRQISRKIYETLRLVS